MVRSRIEREQGGCSGASGGGRAENEKKKSWRRWGGGAVGVPSYLVIYSPQAPGYPSRGITQGWAHRAPKMSLLRGAPSRGIYKRLANVPISTAFDSPNWIIYHGCQFRSIHLPLERISSRFPPRLRKDFFPPRTKNRVEFPHACPWHFRPCSAAYHERSYVTNSGIEDNRIYDGIIQARLLFAEATCTHDARAHPARTGRPKMLDPPTDNHTYSRPPTSNRSITARRLISLENSHHLLTVYCFLKLLQDAVHCGAVERVPTG